MTLRQKELRKRGRLREERLKRNRGPFVVVRPGVNPTTYHVKGNCPAIPVAALLERRVRKHKLIEGLQPCLRCGARTD